MKSPGLKRSPWISTLAIVAILIGVLTIISGGRTLFNASGGSYEMRTVAALGLRAMTWLVISAVAYVKLANHQYQVIV